MASGCKRAGVLAIAIAACTPFTGGSSEPNGAGVDGGDAAAVSLDASTSVDADAATLPDAGVCSPDSCNGRTSCQSYDFEGDTCPQAWTFPLGADTNNAVLCANGKLRVGASNVNDPASLVFAVPPMATTARISMRVAATEWDGGPFVRLMGDLQTIFELRATSEGKNKIIYRWCAPPECEQSDDFEAAPGEERLLTIELSSSPQRISLSVECTPLSSRPIAASSPGPTRLVVGQAASTSVDGTLDDVVVSFE